MRIPYVERYKYLGITSNIRVGREINWEVAVVKARRLANAMTKAL